VLIVSIYEEPLQVVKRLVLQEPLWMQHGAATETQAFERRYVASASRLRCCHHQDQPQHTTVSAIG
jgi:hypothetical protein